MAPDALAVVQSSGSGAYIFILLYGVILFIISYRWSEKFRRIYGRAPWRLPSMIWGLIGFFLGLIGILMQAIAHRTTPGVHYSGLRNNTLGGTFSAGPYGTASYGGATPPYPSYGGGYPPPSVPYGGQPPGAGYYPPPSSATPPPAPPDWYSDPYHLHELRYFDGSTWTEHVSDAGVTSTDPPPEHHL
jgi:hypothetical protein